MEVEGSCSKPRVYHRGAGSLKRVVKLLWTSSAPRASTFASRSASFIRGHFAPASRAHFERLSLGAILVIEIAHPLPVEMNPSLLVHREPWIMILL